MARHLVKAGHEVVVWNRTRAKTEQLASEGAKPASSAAEAAKEAEIAITMLADDHAVTSAVLHAGGIAETLPRGAVHVSMSTISVALSQQLAEEHARRGQQYVAAPVLGDLMRLKQGSFSLPLPVRRRRLSVRCRCWKPWDKGCSSSAKNRRWLTW